MNCYITLITADIYPHIISYISYTDYRALLRTCRYMSTQIPRVGFIRGWYSIIYQDIDWLALHYPDITQIPYAFELIYHYKALHVLSAILDRNPRASVWGSTSNTIRAERNQLAMAHLARAERAPVLLYKVLLSSTISTALVRAMFKTKPPPEIHHAIREFYREHYDMLAAQMYFALVNTIVVDAIIAGDIGILKNIHDERILPPILYETAISQNALSVVGWALRCDPPIPLGQETLASAVDSAIRGRVDVSVIDMLCYNRCPNSPTVLTILRAAPEHSVADKIVDILLKHGYLDYA